MDLSNEDRKKLAHLYSKYEYEGLDYLILETSPSMFGFAEDSEVAKIMREARTAVNRLLELTDIGEGVFTEDVGRFEDVGGFEDD